MLHCTAGLTSFVCACCFHLSHCTLSSGLFSPLPIPPSALQSWCPLYSLLTPPSHSLLHHPDMLFSVSPLNPSLFPWPLFIPCYPTISPTTYPTLPTSVVPLHFSVIFPISFPHPQGSYPPFCRAPVWAVSCRAAPSP